MALVFHRADCPTLWGQEGKYPTWVPPSQALQVASHGDNWLSVLPTTPPSVTCPWMLLPNSPRSSSFGPWVRAAVCPRPHSCPVPQDPLSSLERQLALQLQITEAARRLCAEQNLSRQVRRQRKHAALQEEKKLRELQRCLGERRRNSEPLPPTAHSLGRGEPAALRVPQLGPHAPYTAYVG